MGLMYSASFENTTVTDAAQDIIFLATSAAVPIIIHEIRMSANVTTDIRARISILRRSTSGSAGTAVTARALWERNSVAAATTCTSVRTTPGTAGNLIYNEEWSLLVPFIWTPTPECRPQVGVSGFLGVNLVAGTGASRSMSCNVLFEEL